MSKIAKFQSLGLIKNTKTCKGASKFSKCLRFNHAHPTAMLNILTAVEICLAELTLNKCLRHAVSDDKAGAHCL